MEKDEPKKKPKARLIILSIVSLIVIAIIGVFLIKNIFDSRSNTDEDFTKFTLDSSYYNSTNVNAKIDKDTLAELIKDKKDFVIYASLPQCTGDTALFREYVTKFQEQNKISFYNMTSDVIQETSIYDTVKYYPTVILFKSGEIVKYLRFDSNEDLKYYKSLEGFSQWFKKYINLDE